MKRKRSQEDALQRSEESIPAVGTHHGGSFHIYMNHKVAKLQDLHRGDQIVSEIFKQCIVHVNGITNPPIEEIRRLVTLHGGECVAYRVGVITHLVCDYLTDAQLKTELARSKLNTVKAKVYNVTVNWVIDSIRQGCRQTESLYMPKGLKGRHGANIARLFTSSTNSSATSSSSSSGSSSSWEGLSPDQLVLLHSLPSELQQDAFQQMKQHRIAQQQIVIGVGLEIEVDTNYSCSILESTAIHHVSHRSTAIAAVSGADADGGGGDRNEIPLEDLQHLIDAIHIPSVSHPQGLKPRLAAWLRLPAVITQCVRDYLRLLRFLRSAGDKRTIDSSMGLLETLLDSYAAWLLQREDLDMVSQHSSTLCALLNRVLYR
jgi:hypothetical protein